MVAFLLSSNSDAVRSELISDCRFNLGVLADALAFGP
jgi:hypothetical protein